MSLSQSKFTVIYPIEKVLSLLLMTEFGISCWANLSADAQRLLARNGKKRVAEVDRIVR